MHRPLPAKTERPGCATVDNGPPALSGGPDETGFVSARGASKTVALVSRKQSPAYDILVAVSVDERLPLGYSHKRD